jgi:hypothetical protein
LSIQLHRLHDGADVLLRGDAARLVRAAHDLRHDQRGENAENRDHHHDFDQREPALAACLRRRKFHAAFRPHLHDYYLVSIKMLLFEPCPKRLATRGLQLARGQACIL